MTTLTALLPLDPVLPDSFYDTPNDERSDEEVALWWDKPYACTNADGTFTVRCLDGGAWDRPTSYGRAARMSLACALAERKLAAWHWISQHPVTQWAEDGLMVVQMPRRPGQTTTVLAKFELDDQAGAKAWLEQWRKANPEPVF